MKTPLIVNELTYAANDGTTVSRIDLAPHLKKGAIAFFDEDGNLIAHNASSITGKLVNVVVGLGDSKPYNINTITRSTFSNTYSTYVAPANKKMIIGSDGTLGTLPAASASEDSNAIIYIHNTTQLNDSKPYTEYIVPIAAGSSATQVVNAIVAAINRNSTRMVVAAAKSTDKGITLTGINGNDFKVTLSGMLATADTLEYQLISNVYTASYTSSTHVTKFEVGNATYEQIIQAEKDSQYVRAGRYDTYNDEMSTPFYLADATVTYKEANCEYYDAPYQLKKSQNYINELTIYYTIERTTGTPLATDSLAAIENILSIL